MSEVPLRRVVARPVRRFPPPVAEEPVVVATPPAVPEPEASSWMTTVLPALSSLGFVGFAVVGGSRLSILLGAGMALLAVGAAVGLRAAARRSGRRRRATLRRRYAVHLDGRHRLLVDRGAQQRRALDHRHPPPESWHALESADRLWERRPSDDDFLVVRLGRGRVPAVARPRVDEPSPGTEEEADLRVEADLLVALHACLDDVPVAVDLRRARSLAVVGPEATARPLVRAAVLSLAMLQAPTELRLLVLGGPESSWAAALPHTALATAGVEDVDAYLADMPSSDASERPGPTVLVVDLATASAAALVRRLVAEPPDGLHVLALGTTATDLPATLGAQATVTDDGSVTVHHADNSPDLHVARPDGIDRGGAQQASLVLGGLRPPVAVEAAAGHSPVRLGPLLEPVLAGDVDLPPLAVPLGRDPAGRPVVLDLAEAAAGGDGPHGLLIGATGSGKSELLRTVLAGLVSRAAPDELALVCWDFKGGAAVAPFADLPHTRGTVTNLEADRRFLDRAEAALRAEMRRRQTLLADAGVDSLAELRRTAAGPAVPTLLLVVDEFSELLATAPELIDLFGSLGRLGRSLGIHLLLASQRLDEGRLRGLESHLRYRICLRTFSAGDSHAVLGTDAAARLPAVPGAGLVSLDGRVTRFDGALADDLPERLAGVAARFRCTDDALWPPPLPDAVRLDECRAPDPSAPTVGRRDGLRATIGLVDRPDLQCRHALVVDLDAGHTAVVGGPRSGRTTLLATLTAALAVENGDVAVYAVSDGPALQDLRRLSCVGAVVAADDSARVQALVETLTAQVQRGRSVATGRTVLVIDGWGAFRARHEAAAEALTALSGGDPRAKLHLVLASASWSDFRTGVREHLATKLELRLVDPYESEHGRALAGALPRIPGRLLTPDGHEAQVALAGSGLLARLAAVDGRPAPPVRMLPASIDLSELELSVPDPEAAPSNPSDPHRRVAHRLVLGVSAAGDAPVALDLAGADACLVVVGEAGSGRTTALGTLVSQLDASSTVVWAVDRRRGLRTFVDGSVRHAWSPAGIARLLTELAEDLVLRLPADEDVVAAPRAGLHLAKAPDRRARHVLVVDDYDLLPPAGMAGPLGPVADLLPFVAEIGLSVLVARRGTGRLGYDAGWQSLVDGGATGLVLSGDPMDGPVVGGVRPMRLPAGRGLVVRRGTAPLTVQVATADPARRQPSNARTA